MILKLGMKHQGEELYKVYINHDPGMTLIYFMARSTQVANAFEWGKLSNCYLKGKSERKLSNGLKIYDFEKILALGASLSPPQGNIHVYYPNIQR